MKTIEKNGKPLQDGQTVTVDNVINKFVVEIRSLSGLSADAVKDQLQKRWEVLDIEAIGGTMVVAASPLGVD